MIDDDDILIAEFLADGVLDASVDSNGDISYRLGPNADELQPEFAADMRQAMLQEVDEALLSLYEQGLINISYDEDLNVIFTIPDHVREILDEMYKD